MAGKFEPKTPVNLQPPKDDPITLEELAAANGEFALVSRCQHPICHAVHPPIHLLTPPGVEGGKCYVGIKVSKARPRARTENAPLAW